MRSLSQSSEKVRAKYLSQAIARTNDPLMTAPIERNIVQMRNVTRNRVEKREVQVGTAAGTDSTIKSHELSSGISKRQSEQTIDKVRELVVRDVEQSNALVRAICGIERSGTRVRCQ